MAPRLGRDWPSNAARPPQRGSRARGFTLAETLVALTVFSLAVLAALKLTTDNARIAGALEEKTLAAIVAENRLIEFLEIETDFDRGVRSGETSLGGLEWTWSQNVTTTTVPGMWRIDVTVRREGGSQVLTSLTGFRGER